MGLFKSRTTNNGKTQVPVWFMRQAGRYHNHYQNIKKDSDFNTMCKEPILACEITHGPISDFNFDAAILFSDLLFPLENLNFGLSYKSGPPTLERRLENTNEITKFRSLQPAKDFYQFQKEALTLLKKSLPVDKTLLGFIGAPFTLYAYACEGSHAGNLTNSKLGFFDHRFENFMEVLLPELLTNMFVQAEGGADAICLFDTAAGELTLSDYKDFALPKIKILTKEFKKKYPETKIIYYSKHTNLTYLQEIQDENIDVLGIDWRVNLPDALNLLSQDYYIQGNLDPSYLHLPWEKLQTKLEFQWQSLTNANVDFSKWISGLGHGVLQHTPEMNVKNTVKYIQENYIY
ncbi:MAG: uroporphyrinogen decarboxylase [Bdellovibrionales bacterium]|jgi:uroporphyrinogen decarboxylase|nr:uroporphyrinogen decarboxylase [Bdellovibrionales bacterium]